MTPGASHLLVLQDDALPAPGFAEKLSQALSQQPASILCAFTPGFAYLRKQLAEAKARGLAFSPLRVGAFVPCVAIVYPAAVAADVLEWTDAVWTQRQQRQLRGADDGVIAMYCRRSKMQPLLMVPPIVEHDATVDSIGKLHRRTGPHRSAALI
jgi:hypothetical protein